MIKSPASILFDINGNPISVVDGYAVNSSTPGLMIAGSDGTNARLIRLSTDGTVRIDPTGNTTQPVSAVSLPLPTDAATETTLLTRLSDSTFTTRINTLGQKTMSQSTPVVLASNQSAIPVTISEGNAGGVLKSLYDIGGTDIYIGTASPGTAPSAAAWLIAKITLDVSGNPISKLYSSDTAIWDNRTTETYS